jgi:thiol-disulfide isomerase/thioredoxin
MRYLNIGFHGLKLVVKLVAPLVLALVLGLVGCVSAFRSHSLVAQEVEGVQQDGFIDLFGTEAESRTATGDEASASQTGAAEVSNTTPDPKPPVGERVRLEPVHTMEAGIKLAQLEQRPLLVIFGADWCSWCRKLEAELVLDEADAVLKQWVIAHVDVDDEPEVAESMQANALPALRLLGPQQQVVAQREGYLPLAELQTWLNEGLLLASPEVQRVLYDTTKLSETDLAKLIAFLGDRTPSIRAAAQTRLAGQRGRAAGVLMQVLRTGGLAQQLSALEILHSWDAPVQGIDPWQPESLTDSTLEPLLQWMRAQEELKDESSVEAESQESVDPGLASEVLTNVQKTPSEATMAAAVKMGKGLIADVRQRLAVAGESTESESIALQELLYRLLASPQTRLENGSLLVALASRDADSHRRAADKLLEMATPLDQPLVDELSQDADVLVRERAVSRLSELGLLFDAERFRRLLADRHPSVRTAVLRALAEDPEESSIAAVIEYVERETDEDLLVYATKALGQLGNQGGANACLSRLAGNESWRVRAAALDAIGEAIQSNRSGVLHFPGSTSSQAKDESESDIATAILNRLEDSDSFVVEKASQLLPKILSAGTVEPVAEYLLTHPERIKEFTTSQMGYGYGDDAPSELLANQVEKWVDSSEPDRVRAGAVLLSQLKPEKLQKRIVVLAQSEDADVRIAVARSILRNLEDYRSTELERFSGSVHQHSPEVSDGVAKHAWYEVPESLATLPPKKKAIVAQRNKPSSGELEGDLAVDDMFGSKSTDEGGNGTESLPGVEIEPDPSLAVVDDFFGAPAFVVGPAQTEIASSPERPSLALEKQQEETGFFSMLGAIGSLLGGSPSEVEVVEERWEDEGGSHSGLPSEWFDLYRNQELAKKQPKWIAGAHEAVEKRIAELQASNADAAQADPKMELELAWMQAAALALGNSQMENPWWSTRSSVIDAIEDGPSRRPHLLDIIAWLPSEERMEHIRSIDLESQRANEQSRALIMRATEIDELQIADWIWDDVSPPLTTYEQLTLWQPSLLRALLGRSASSISEYRYVYEGSEWDSSQVLVPGVERATAWLTERFQKAETPLQRSLLLSCLSYVDYKLAVDSATGLIAAADQYDESVKIALAISLCSNSERSVDRAVQWLTHSLPEVKRMALLRLTSTSTQMLEHTGYADVVREYDYENYLPGFYTMRRDLPVGELKTYVDTTEESFWRAQVLLLAAGEDLPWQTLIAGKESLDAKLQFAAALSISGHDDEESVAFYESLVEEVANQHNPAVIYQLVRNMTSNPAQELRKRLRKIHGSSVIEAVR